jgi:hypothetical protein
MTQSGSERHTTNPTTIKRKYITIKVTRAEMPAHNGKPKNPASQDAPRFRTSRYADKAI